MKVEIGRRLKHLREGTRLTQKEFASKVKGGIDYTYIGKIERGEQLPSLKVLLKVCEAFSVPIGYFFQDEEAAAMVELCLYGLGSHVRDEKWQELIKALRLVNHNDIPLLIEIIHALNRQRKGAEAAEESGKKCL